MLLKEDFTRNKPTNPADFRVFVDLFSVSRTNHDVAFCSDQPLITLSMWIHGTISYVKPMLLPTSSLLVFFFVVSCPERGVRSWGIQKRQKRQMQRQTAPKEKKKQTLASQQASSNINFSNWCTCWRSQFLPWQIVTFAHLATEITSKPMFRPSLSNRPTRLVESCLA